MKSGIHDRPKLIAAVTLMTVALLVTGRWIAATRAAGSTASSLADEEQSHNLEPLRSARAGPTQPLDPTIHFARLESVERELYTGNGRNIFSDMEHEEQRIGNKAQGPPPTKTALPLPPSIPLKFFGFATMIPSPRKVFLRKEDTLFVATEGDVIDRRYKVGRIGSDSVEIEDLIENRQQTLVLPPG